MEDMPLTSKSRRLGFCFAECAYRRLAGILLCYHYDCALCRRQETSQLYTNTYLTLVSPASEPRSTYGGGATFGGERRVVSSTAGFGNGFNGT